MFVPSSRACHILQLRVWFEAATRRTFQLEPRRPCNSQQYAAYFASNQQHVREPGGLRASRIGPQEQASNISRGNKAARSLRQRIQRSGFDRSKRPSSKYCDTVSTVIYGITKVQDSRRSPACGEPRQAFSPSRFRSSTFTLTTACRCGLRAPGSSKPIVRSTGTASIARVCYMSASNLHKCCNRGCN
jgi:hypothetical protein